MPHLPITFQTQAFRQSLADDLPLFFGVERPAPGHEFDEMLRRVAETYPGLRLIGTQLRAPLSADRINWGAVLYDVKADKMHLAAVRENVEIADRTGGGDSFASGVAAALMKGKDPADAVQWGAAHGICVQSTPGDTTMVTQVEVEKEVKRAVTGGGVSALR